MMTEEKIMELVNSWTPKCIYSKDEFEEMTREECRLHNNWEKRTMKRYWKFLEKVATGEIVWDRMPDPAAQLDPPEPP